MKKDIVERVEKSDFQRTIFLRSRIERDLQLFPIISLPPRHILNSSRELPKRSKISFVCSREPVRVGGSSSSWEM